MGHCKCGSKRPLLARETANQQIDDWRPVGVTNLIFANAGFVPGPEGAQSWHGLVRLPPVHLRGGAEARV
jgi:hypothetical protein